MSSRQSDYLTTRELAELLRLKERKIYELVSAGEVPCTRATGKLLFSRRAIESWMAENSTGPALETGQARPAVFLGSHDPLLEWALRESACGCATFFDGSLDGLQRFADRQGIAAGLHVYEAAEQSWNVAEVSRRFAGEPVVLTVFCWRERGLVVRPDERDRLDSLVSLVGRKVARRQSSAGSQTLLLHLLAEAGIEPETLRYPVTARNESDAALAVLDGKADAAFGLLGMARQYRLEFVPLVRERFDLLVDRHAWFEPAMQKLVAFCASNEFGARARELGGYDVAEFGRVMFNGAP